MHIGGLIKRLDMLNTYHSGVDVDAHGLTDPQLNALNAVYELSSEGERPSQRMLERRLMLSNPTVTGILNRLEAKGMIARERDKIDARIRRIRITQAGVECRMQVHGRLDAREERLIAPLSGEEREQLSLLLLKMIANLENTEEERIHEETESEL